MTDDAPNDPMLDEQPLHWNDGPDLTVPPGFADSNAVEPGSEPMVFAIEQAPWLTDVLQLGSPEAALVITKRRSAGRSPLLWLAMLLGVVLAAVMTYGYVGAFVDPIGHLRDLPVGLVVLDEPQQVGATEVAIGDQLAASLLADDSPTRPTIAWRSYGTTAQALSDLHDNQLAGIVIVPADTSYQVVAIGLAGGAAPAANIEVIRNDGAGSLQPAVVDQITRSIEASLNDQVSGQLTATLTGLGRAVAPADVASVARPIEFVTTADPALETHGGRGLPPFYIAVMITLTGLLGATVIHLAFDVATGAQHFELLGTTTTGRFARVSRSRRWGVEAWFLVPFSLLSGLVIQLVAIDVLGAQSGSRLGVAAFCMLGVLAISAFSLLMLTAFGVAGDLIVLLATTIFGVPSARGVYPAEALPDVFRTLGDLLPLRYLTDGLRSLMYFDGREAAGLGDGVRMTCGYAAVSAILGWVVSMWAARRERSATSRGPQPTTPDADLFRMTSPSTPVEAPIAAP